MDFLFRHLMLFGSNLLLVTIVLGALREIKTQAEIKPYQVHMSLRQVSERDGSNVLRDPEVRRGDTFELVCRIRVPASRAALASHQQHQRIGYPNEVEAGNGIGDGSGIGGVDEEPKWRVYWRTVARSFWPQNESEYGDWTQLGRLELCPRTFETVPHIRRQFRDRVQTSGWIGRVGSEGDVVVLAHLAVRDAEFNDTGIYRCVIEFDGQRVYTDYMAEQQTPADVSIKGVVSAGQVQIECSSVLSDLDPSLNFYALVYLAFYRQLNSVKVSGSEASLPQHTSRPQKLCLLENDITYYTSAAGNTSHYELRHACEAGEGDGFEGGRLSAEALDEMQMRLDPEPGPTSGTLHFTVRLTLQRVTRADAGRYWCELTHPDFMPFSLLQPFALRSSLVPFSPPHPWRELETEAHMMHNVHMEGTETETETEKSSHPDGGREQRAESTDKKRAESNNASITQELSVRSEPQERCVCLRPTIRQKLLLLAIAVVLVAVAAVATGIYVKAVASNVRKIPTASALADGCGAAGSEQYYQTKTAPLLALMVKRVLAASGGKQQKQQSVEKSLALKTAGVQSMGGVVERNSRW